MKYYLIFLFCVFMSVGIGHTQDYIDVSEYKDLFDAVQSSKVFKDQKKFADCIPMYPIDEILDKYNSERDLERFDLKAFVASNFDTLFIDTTDLLLHINNLWSYLSRYPDVSKDKSTLIPLKHPYIVPGGRFREIYYWDSYFTMLGLLEAERYKMIENMLDNMTDLVMTFGHIPNGNRTYYLSRSQPPFFSLMIDLYAKGINNDTVYKKYYRALKLEYDFWTRDNAYLNNSLNSIGRSVMLNNNEVLNRYWDDLSTPRPESYLADIETFNEANQDSSIFRNIRAAAESGWDFSSRWFADEKSLKTIHTTDIIPVDLNCLLYFQEITLSKGCSKDSVLFYTNLAEKRKGLINDYFWDEKSGFFFDYNYISKTQTSVYSLAALYPLFFNLVDSHQAKKVATFIQDKFLKEGGLVTTLYNSGQQWDYPNGWAPLQWIGYKALKNYGFEDLANEIASRWINLNVKVFFETNKMMEKYDVVNTHKSGGGGEYELQDGFGWTNGVFLKLWNVTNEE